MALIRNEPISVILVRRVSEVLVRALGVRTSLTRRASIDSRTVI